MTTLLNQSAFSISHKPINEKPDNMRKIDIADLQGTAYYFNKCKNSAQPLQTPNSLKNEVAEIETAILAQKQFEEVAKVTHSKIVKNKEIFIILAILVLILIVR